MWRKWSSLFSRSQIKKIAIKTFHLRHERALIWMRTLHSVIALSRTRYAVLSFTLISLHVCLLSVASCCIFFIFFASFDEGASSTRYTRWCTSLQYRDLAWTVDNRKVANSNIIHLRMPVNCVRRRNIAQPRVCPFCNTSGTKLYGQTSRLRRHPVSNPVVVTSSNLSISMSQNAFSFL